ncbi:MAG: acyl carrier protein [Candidatus Omnitrophota bacterium]
MAASKNILIVDDERGLVQALESFFKTKGHNVHTAHTGKDALDLLKKQGVDLMILDLNMPGVSGAEIAKVSKEKYPRTKILILTAYAQEHKKKLLSVEVEEVITKPFGMIMLVNKVQELLGQEPDIKPVPDLEYKGHRPVRVLFIDPAMDYILKDYVLPYMQLSWGDNINVESINPTPPSAAREKIMSFKPDIVLLSALLAKQAEGLSLDIAKNIYRPKEAIIYNVPGEQEEKEKLADTYYSIYSMQKSLIDPDYLDRLNDLIKETAIKHQLVDEEFFSKKKPALQKFKSSFTVEDVGEFVKDAIAKELNIGKDKITEDASFVEDLGVDSLDTIELTMALEDVFGIELPDEDVGTMRTVKAAIDYIKKKADLKELARRKRGAYKILIVDDQEAMCKFLESYFQAKGYEAYSTAEPKKVLAIVEKEKPDAVLLDIKMPDTDGIELLKRIKEKHPAAKVIMVSVALEKKDEATRLGADAFISKPFPITYLEKTVIGKIRELMT